jgi:hypothetical protein
MNKANKSRIEGVHQTVHNRLINKVIFLLRGLFDVLLVHFGRLPDQSQALKLSLKWMQLAALDRLEEYYKFQSCFLFSLVTRQQIYINEMPKKPEWLTDREGFILGGWFFRYARLCMQKKLTSEVVSQFYAIMNVKRAGASISRKKINESLDKHKRNMRGAEFNPKDLTLNEYLHEEHCWGPNTLFTKETLLDRVIDRMNDLVKKCYGGKNIHVKWRCPSISACFEFTRIQGGPHTFFERREYGVWPFLQPEFAGFLSYRTRVIPFYVHYHPEQMLFELKTHFMGYDFDQPLDARVHEVLEPFKARIITAGPGLLYHYGRLLQKPLHTLMRHFGHMFRLTGQPVTRELISEVYKDCVLTPEEFFDPKKDLFMRSFFCAGDYSNATDGMHPLIGQRWCEQVHSVTNLSSLDLRVLKACMKGHRMHYPDGSVVQQEHGQLMGSPISFLVLCFANAAVNWVSADIYYGRQVPFKTWIEDFRPLFNGDDTSFLTNSAHYNIWKRVAASVGLNPSLGKSYCTPDFVMINSEIFWMCKDETYGYVKDVMDVFVLNPGLVKGQAKVLSDTRIERPETTSHYGELLPMVDQLNKAMAKGNDKQRKLVQDLFVDHCLPKLKRVNRSWCLPRWLGGLGLPFGNANYSQRLLAGMALMSIDGGDFNFGALTSYEKDVPECVAHERDLINELQEQLGVEFTRSFEKPKDDGVSLSKYFIGGTRVPSGCDRYNSLLKEALKHPWINPITDEAISEYMQKKSYLVPIGGSPVVQ